ncbi:MAG: 1-deoxy-D-xylulose-5-phosphate synthase 1 [Gemmatimonadota bacterium]|nr:MAG: 1-deoxy-D-xylulose-5-phosphate synthase 1 [Gemmatimonadota bacterium]
MDRILDRIERPQDLRKLSTSELITLSAELREEIIDTVTKTGGHLGASLGAVELTLAIHRVYDAPKDKVVWDVGHQAYGHKLLTGRRDQFSTIRQYSGLSGFPLRSESEYDAFGVAHAGTSISAGLGMATAFDAQGSDARVVCVIGDGGLTCGMAFEALNQAGHLKKDLLVILNDNEWSISKNVGALSTYLTRLTSRPLYRRLEQDVWELLGRIPKAGDKAQEAAHRIKESLKNLLVPGVMFEELGFKYYGPIDGHNLQEVISTLEHLKHQGGPILLHAVTEKGKGYPFAPTSKTRAHGVSPPADPKKSAPAYTKVFGSTLVEMAARDPSIVAITAAMPDGTGTGEFAEAYPDRFFDVGIAEQHAVTFAAGLACEGMKPFCAIYSTFLQRAFDQVEHDVALQNLPVKFVLDRAGLVGDDGPTHHGVFDIAYLRVLPNFVIMSPKDENELRHMLYTMAQYHDGPIALRFPRGSGVGVSTDEALRVLPIGQAEPLREGDQVTLLGLGSMVHPCLDAAKLLEDEGISTGVVNARFVKPLDEELILELASRPGLLVTVEEAQRAAGFGSAVAELLQDREVDARILSIGIADEFIHHAKPEIQHRSVGLTAETIAARVAKQVRSAAPVAMRPSA